VLALFIDDKIDTGAIILSSEIAINPNENAGHARQINAFLAARPLLKP
jgi:methionyl-tRNA formyltransferase